MLFFVSFVFLDDVVPSLRSYTFLKAFTFYWDQSAISGSFWDFLRRNFRLPDLTRLLLLSGFKEKTPGKIPGKPIIFLVI